MQAANSDSCQICSVTWVSACFTDSIQTPFWWCIRNLEWIFYLMFLLSLIHIPCMWLDVWERLFVVVVVVLYLITDAHICNLHCQIRRRVKQVPVAFYKAIPSSLFSESDFTGWTFEVEEEGKGKKSENGILNSPEDKDICCTKRQRVGWEAASWRSVKCWLFVDNHVWRICLDIKIRVIDWCFIEKSLF